MAVVSIINQKGGVAKTTTSVNIAASWSSTGRKVLLIDLDPQASATRSIFGEEEFEKTIFDVFINRLPPEEAVVRSKVFSIDVIPSEILLSGVDIQIAAHFGREKILKNKIDGIRKKYDAVIIDCAPSLGLLTINALMASRDIIIPICPEYFSLKGIELILETLKNLRIGLGHKVHVRGIVISRYRDRKIAKSTIDEIRQAYGLKIFESYIPDNIAVEEAHHKHLPVIDHAPLSGAAKAFHALAEETWA